MIWGSSCKNDLGRFRDYIVCNLFAQEHEGHVNSMLKIKILYASVCQVFQIQMLVMPIQEIHGNRFWFELYKYVASLLGNGSCWRHFRRAMLFHWRSSAGCLIGSCFGVPAQAYLGSQQLGSTLGFDQNLSVTMKVCCSSSFIFFFTSYLAIGCKSSASVCRKPYIITGSVFWGQRLIRRDEAFISDVSLRNCASFNAKRAVDGKATTMMEGNRMKQIARESFVRLYLSFPKPVNFCTEARWYLFGIAWCWRCCQVWPDAPVGRRHAFVVVVVVPSDGVFTRRHTAECAFCTVFYSVFCFSTMLPWGGEGGGQEQLFLRVMFSAFVHLHWFLQCFSPFRTFFLHHLRFPLVFTVFSGFMTLLMLRCTLGWGGVGQSRSCELDKSRCWGFIMLLMLQGGC